MTIDGVSTFGECATCDEEIIYVPYEVEEEFEN